MIFPCCLTLYCIFFVQIWELYSHAGKKIRAWNTLSTYFSIRVREIDIQKEREKERNCMEEREGIGVSSAPRHPDQSRVRGPPNGGCFGCSSGI